MNAYLLKYTFSKAAQTIFQKAIAALHPPQEQILEPFSTMVRLAIIAFKEFGTKIAVSDNRLYIQSPSPLQGAIRTAYGNNREEIHYLLKPIMRCLEMYPAMGPNHTVLNAHLVHIYELAIEGLKKLKRNYGSGMSTVSHSIDLYISIISSHIQGGSKVMVDSFHPHDEMGNHHSSDISSGSNNNSYSSSSLTDSVYNIVDIDQLFRTMWDDSDFELISKMFISAEACKEGKAIDYYIDSIGNIIKAKENHISEKLHKLVQQCL